MHVPAAAPIPSRSHRLGTRIEHPCEVKSARHAGTGQSGVKEAKVEISVVEAESVGRKWGRQRDGTKPLGGANSRNVQARILALGIGDDGRRRVDPGNACTSGDFAAKIEDA